MTNTRIANRAGRRLVVADMENLTATPSPTAFDVEAVIAALAEVVPGFEDAQLTVACSHRAAKTVAFACPPAARHLWRDGADGADLALLEVLEDEHVEERYEYVTICSGDGIFAASAARLAQHGVDTTVVALEGHIAARLKLAAQHVVLLPPTAISIPPTGSAS